MYDSKTSALKSYIHTRMAALDTHDVVKVDVCYSLATNEVQIYFIHEAINPVVITVQPYHESEDIIQRIENYLDPWRCYDDTVL